MALVSSSVCGMYGMMDILCCKTAGGGFAGGCKAAGRLFLADFFVISRRQEAVRLGGKFHAHHPALFIRGLID